MVSNQQLQVPEVSVPAIGVDQANLVNSQTVRSVALAGPVKRCESIVTEIHDEKMLADGTTVIQTRFLIAVCAGCGKPIQSNSEIGAMCFWCHYVLKDDDCLDNFRCSRCKRQACPHCGDADEEGRFLCRLHTPTG